MDLQLQTCSDVTYNRTAFPTLLRHQSRAAVESSSEYILLSVLHQLLEGQCNPDLAPPPPQDPSPLRGTLGSSLRSPAEGLAKRWEPRGFSRVAAAFSSYNGEFTLAFCRGP